MKSINFFGVVVMLIIAGLIFQDRRKGHECPFPDCPFKGDIHFNPAHSECDESTDCYCMDLLHFEYPTASYDELEDMLFNNQKPETDKPRIQ